MSKRGDHIRKRTDGRWEGRYTLSRSEVGKIKYRSVYGHSYAEVKTKLNEVMGILPLGSKSFSFEVIAMQ